MNERVTDDERREVAVRLRDGEGYRREVANRLRAGREHVPVMNFIADVVTGGHTAPQIISLPRLLADLIDRPTCQNVYDGREFECSECGMRWRLFDRESEDEGWARVRSPRYCPSCGAEVVRDGR